MSHGMWLYYRFSHSYRNVDELMVERGVTVSYEAVAIGVARLGKRMPISCAVPVLAIHGTWTKSSS